MVFYSVTNAAGAAGNVPSALVCEKPNGFLAQPGRLSDGRTLLGGVKLYNLPNPIKAMTRMRGHRLDCELVIWISSHGSWQDHFT